MRLLELFCGTSSVGKEFPGEVVSLDILGRPTHKFDMLEWDHTIYPPGHFPQSGLAHHARNIARRELRLTLLEISSVQTSWYIGR